MYCNWVGVSVAGAEASYSAILLMSLQHHQTGKSCGEMSVRPHEWHRVLNCSDHEARCKTGWKRLSMTWDGHQRKTLSSEKFYEFAYCLRKRKRTQPGNWRFYLNSDTALRADWVNGPLAVVAFIQIGTAVVLWWWLLYSVCIFF